MYKKIDLDYSSLEPYIDDLTLNIHYNKHYGKYLDNLNKLLDSVNYDYKYSLKELVKNINIIPEDIRGEVLYNAGGVLNHKLYFSTLNTRGKKEVSGNFNKEETCSLKVVPLLLSSASMIAL